MASGTPRLAILATTRAAIWSDGQLRLSRKFVDGVIEHQRGWPGRTSVFMEPARTDEDDLDRITLQQGELPFSLTVKPFVLGELAEGLASEPTTVLAPLAGRFLSLQRMLLNTDIRWVAWVEWSLSTRKRTTALTTSSPMLRAKRLLGAVWRERGLRLAARLADGLQCNGTPAHANYGACNTNTLLYFDGRVARSMLPTLSAVEARLVSNSQRGKLRLAFSGRLTRIKGADHLVEVAVELRRLGADFEMVICGAGDLTDAMRTRLAAAQLEKNVCFKGILEFGSELIPLMRSWPDIFVCCHRQGDPSCTYLETFCCGVPIAGYANEAFEGLHRASGAGWLTPLDKPELLARRLAALANDRDAIRCASLRALEFGAQHTFEDTFSARTQHLLATSLA